MVINYPSDRHPNTNVPTIQVYFSPLSFPKNFIHDNKRNNTVDLGCNEVKGSELKFRYNQGFVTDKVLYNM